MQAQKHKRIAQRDNSTRTSLEQLQTVVRRARATNAVVKNNLIAMFRTNKEAMLFQQKSRAGLACSSKNSKIFYSKEARIYYTSFSQSFCPSYCPQRGSCFLLYYNNRFHGTTFRSMLAYTQLLLNVCKCIVTYKIGFVLFCIKII